MKQLKKIKTVIHEKQIGLYAEVSGDRNPIHTDHEFAIETQFGGVIAHGMLTLAYISEMLVEAFGANWFKTGRLKVRFKRPAYPGNKIHTEGRIVNIRSDSNQDLVDCLVALVDSDTDEELITGKASVTIIKGNVRNGCN